MAAIWAKIQNARRRGSLAQPADKENCAPNQIVPGATSSKYGAGIDKRGTAGGRRSQVGPRRSSTEPVQRSTPRTSESDRTKPSMHVKSAAKVVPKPSLQKTDIVVKNKSVPFQAPASLSFSKGIGYGAYGVVAAFRDNRPARAAGKGLAIKFVRNAFHDLLDGQRILREIRLLRCLRHDNIVQLHGLYCSGSDCQDIYIVTDLMDSDLGKIIKSSEVLSEEHHRWFTYQSLRALLYIHSAGVVHRDIKPSNILVNKDCALKICDFGLSRGGTAYRGSSEHKLTEYVVTRYYRAPEVILLSSDYGAPIDIWAVGCVMAELIARKPLFKGKDPMDQITQIFKVLGSPQNTDLAWLSHNSSAMRFVRRFSGQDGQPLAPLLPKASTRTLSAVKSMLVLDPSKRPAVIECMRLPCFEGIYQPADEQQVAPGLMDWSFDEPKPTLRSLQTFLRAEHRLLAQDLRLPVYEDSELVYAFA
eukprot:TRINITY_DN22452_c0_g1_i1.p1 TRINITY_DN22452_c0_g1~~TRINITY_DN22452_c0_g1_i1.p1  ORF type:complete len:494 (-),score=49.74 TRINITY_DN22452_c0_g1_i1:213-1634(-)